VTAGDVKKLGSRRATSARVLHDDAVSADTGAPVYPILSSEAAAYASHCTMTVPIIDG
jgi:hypothetical protein